MKLFSRPEDVYPTEQPQKARMIEIVVLLGGCVIGTMIDGVFVAGVTLKENKNTNTPVIYCFPSTPEAHEASWMPSPSP